MIRKHDNIKFSLEIFWKYMLVKEEDNLRYVEGKSLQIKMVIINLSSLTTDDLLNIYKTQCDFIVKKLLNSRNLVADGH